MSYGSYWRDKADQLQAALNAERKCRLSAEAKLAQAVEALRPFAKMAAAYDGLLEDENVPVLAQDRVRIMLHDLRRARAAAAMGEKPLATSKDTP